MSRPPTNSLERALVILQYIGNTPGGLTNLEISREFNIARSTCSYILSRLEREGYLARDPGSRKYRLGLKTVVLGRGALREMGCRVAESTLYRLAGETGLAANLAVLEGGRVLVLDRIEGFAFMKAATAESAEVGAGGRASLSQNLKRRQHLRREYGEPAHEMPVCTTALGKALLANLPSGHIGPFLDQAEARKGPGQEYDFCRERLIAELAAIRDKGYCMMPFQPYNESCALAVPILDANRTLRGAVSVSCKRHLAIWNDEFALSKLIKEAAWEISSRLQYHKRAPSLQKHAGAGA